MLDQTPEGGTTSKYHNWQRWVQMSSLGLLESPSPRELEYGALRMIGGNRIARVAGFRRRRRRTPGKLLSKPSSLPSRLRSRPLRSPPVPIMFPMPAQLHTIAPLLRSPHAFLLKFSTRSREALRRPLWMFPLCSHPLRSPSASTVLKVIGNA